ncbi:MAG: SH3 domain-containing protein [Christensenellales bacterium]|jgi:uncharacterized protein YgiM (DUF1202 family)
MKALRLFTCLLAAALLLTGCSLFDSGEVAPPAVTALNPDGGFTITAAPTEMPTLVPAETIAVQITPIPSDEDPEESLEPTATIDLNATPKITTTMYVSLTDTSLTLNVRSRASTKGRIVAKLVHGTQLEVYSITSGWAKLGDGFYVSSKFLTDKAPTNVEITIYDPLGGTVASTPAAGGTLAPGTTGAAPITGNVVFDTPQIMYVKLTHSTNRLRTRSIPSTKGKILGHLYDGDIVKVVSITDGWAKLNTNPVSYCMAKYLTAEAPVTTTMYVTTNRPGSHLYVRDRPSTAGKILDRLTNGTAVEVVSTAKGWAKLAGTGDRYVRLTYLSMTPPAGYRTVAPTLKLTASPAATATPTPTP